MIKFARQVAIFALLLLLTGTGCSTLSSLGLPGGSTNNMLQSAKKLSQSQSQSYLVPKELRKADLPNYIIEAGDTLFIEPVSFDATIRLSGDQIVKPDGTISIGEFGRYVATQKTVEQVQIEVQSVIDQGIRDQLEHAYFLEEQERQAEQARKAAKAQAEGTADADQLTPEEEMEAAAERRRSMDRRIVDQLAKNKVSVRLVNWDSKRFYVLGEVNSPGSFNFVGNETVLDAIVQAGGLNSKANQHQIIVTRPTPCDSCRTVMRVCYQQIVQLGDSSTNYQLQPGDRVFVPSLTFAEDLKQSLLWFKEDKCPNCANDVTGCNLPQGCEQ